MVTKDGATVAKNIVLEDHFENLGADLMKVVSRKTEQLAGDGTTSSILIAQTMLQEGIRYVVADIEINGLLQGLKKGMTAVVESIKKQAVPISNQTQLEQIAITAANNDTYLGKTIASAFFKDKNISIKIEEGKAIAPELEISKGVQLNYGYASRYFASNGNVEVSLEEAYVLITDVAIDNIKSILPLLSIMVDEKKPLLIFTSSISDELLTLIITNKQNGALDAVIIKIADQAVLQNELFSDLALLTGAMFISKEKGDSLENTKVSDLGFVKKALITQQKTILTIPDKKNQATDSLLLILKEKSSATDDRREKEKIADRIQRLKGTVATLYVGASTQTEYVEKKFLAEDAVRAVESAIEEGIAPGGGITFIHSLKVLNEVAVGSRAEKAGLDILKISIKAPLQAMLENSGKHSSQIIDKISAMPDNYGYNLNTDTIEEMFNSGIIDPVKVLRLQLQHAYSIVSQILSTRCAIVEKSERDEP